MSVLDSVGNGKRLAAEAIDQLFLEARTYVAWKPEPVSQETLKELYRLARMGPTSANACPARFVFITSTRGKERLLPALMPGNLDKTRSAPVTAIIAWDVEFYERLPHLMPFVDFRSYFAGNQPLIDETGMRNSSLQAAYFILAARSLGLDCGPMSGFDADKLNAEFFPDGKWKVNLLCNLGHGDREKLYPRAPRLEFDEACQVL